MRETGRREHKPREQNADLAGAARNHGCSIGDLAAYAAEVKRLTNYEVWRNVESALVDFAPGVAPEGVEWWNLQILLDELKWRLSGLEGSGSTASRTPMTIGPN